MTELFACSNAHSCTKIESWLFSNDTYLLGGRHRGIFGKSKNRRKNHSVLFANVFAI
jgi:hypothetical protein